LATRERETWSTAAEIFGLGLLLVSGTSVVVRLVFGLPLLAHVGYKALTSLPMGLVPGRPERGQVRRHYDLRACVKRFLDEVKMAESFAQRAELADLPKEEVDDFLYKANQRVMHAAREVAKHTGREVARA
jgi:hypothetical protein